MESQVFVGGFDGAVCCSHSWIGQSLRGSTSARWGGTDRLSGEKGWTKFGLLLLSLPLCDGVSVYPNPSV